MLLSPGARAVLAELVGAAALVTAIVGAGISASALTDDFGLRLLVNAIATALVLGILIATLATVSGAHFNPVVTLALALRGDLPWSRAWVYVPAQLLGAAGGTLLAHAMYERALVSEFAGERGGSGAWLGEVVATAGLVLLVLAAPRDRLAVLVPGWIAAAYFMTSSTSFANPAVTVGRALTDSFAGIGWADVPGFVAAQLAGGLLAVVALRLTSREHA